MACGDGDAPPKPEFAYVRNPSVDTASLVVFVHGFGSDARSAWTNKANGAYWPELVASDPELVSFAVATASYRSPRLRRAATLDEGAVALGFALQDRGIYKQFSHVVFVAHSAGGLVVRRLLTRLFNSGNRAAFNRVAVAFFFATPTSGAPLADVVGWLSANPQTRDLSASEFNSYLQALDNDWEEVLRQRPQVTAGRPLVFCGYATRDTSFGAIVPKLYSKTSCDEAPRPFDRDHSTLVKPRDRNDSVYEWTKKRLQGAPRRQGEVSWTAGETLGNRVLRLRDHYRDGSGAEQVRYAPGAEVTISRLWIPKADYRRDSWGELVQAVAVDEPCLGVRVDVSAGIAEVYSAGAVKSCGDVNVCAGDQCPAGKDP
jgi:hypothetical protein